MARNLFFTINKLYINRCFNGFNTISNHNLRQHLRRLSTNHKKILVNDRKYYLVGCSSALIASIFGSNILFNYYKSFKNINDQYEQSLTKLLSDFILRRAQLFLKDNQNKDNTTDDNSLSASKRFNFIADVTEKVSSAVVFIEVFGRHPFVPNTTISISSGSGFIVNSDGLILTNAHVVAHSKTVSVKLSDGRVFNGVVECVDDRLDLATVKIDSKGLPFIKLGDSRKSRPGEWVIAMGSPFSLSNTITVGVVSSINRAGKELGLFGKEMDYIQTDASINIGNSGGPLVNLDGEAIGINTMKVTAGISFAIPSSYAIDFLERAEQFKKKKLSKGKSGEPVPKKNRYIGITMLTLTPKLIEQFHSRETDFPNVTSGVLIWKVVLGSPAHLEGLQPRDIIVKVNGETATSASDIYKALESDKPLNVTVRRKDREINLVIKPQIID